MLLNITYFNGVFILLIPQIFHLTSSAWCELFVYANQNRGGSSWPSGTGFDVAECINTDGNFQNDVISSAYLESKSGYTCTAIFYEACTCAGRTETLIVNPHSSNTINFGTIDNLVSCIKVIVHTPQPTFTPTTHQPSIVTLSPTLISLQPTFTPSISPSNNPTTAYPTLISYSPTLSPTNSITVIFDYKTTNISQIEIELSIITQNIINQRILVNNLTNCAITNNYNISIKNTLKSVNITNAKIRATIFVCDDTSQYKLYATFNETLQTDFIEKLQLIAIQPNGFHIDVDIVCDNIECMSTTKQLIYTTIYDKMDNQNIDMNFVVIIIVVIMTLLFIIVILIGIVLKLKPKFMNSMKTLELNTVSNDINSNDLSHDKIQTNVETVGKDNLIENVKNVTNVNEANSTDDVNEIYEKKDDAIVTIGNGVDKDDDMHRDHVTNDVDEDDDMYRKPSKNSIVTYATPTTAGNNYCTIQV